MRGGVNDLNLGYARYLRTEIFSGMFFMFRNISVYFAFIQIGDYRSPLAIEE